MPKQKATRQGALRIAVTPNWKGSTFESFASPAFEAFHARLKHEWSTKQHPRGVGRPSLYGPVSEVSRQVLKDWGGTLRNPPRSIGEFTHEVWRRLTERDRRDYDPARVAQHTRVWMKMKVPLGIEDYPDSYLRSRHGRSMAVLLRHQEQIARILTDGSLKERRALFDGLTILASPPALAADLTTKRRGPKRPTARPSGTRTR